jgi:hypothetical protein
MRTSRSSGEGLTPSTDVTSMHSLRSLIPTWSSPRTRCSWRAATPIADEGIRAWWENILAVYPDFRAEIDDVRDVGDLTITRLRIHGRGVESDAPMDQEVWQVVRIREGQGIFLRFFSSEAEALEAVGMVE